MNFTGIVGIFVFGYTILVRGQSPQPIPAGVLQQLASSDWHARAQAMEQLISDPHVLKAPATTRALIQLLDRENHFLGDPATFKFSGVDENEAWSAYYDLLLGRVDSLVDSSDAAGVSVLIQSSYNGDSPFALKLASYGQTVVTPLLKRAGDQRHRNRRSEAYEVLGSVLQQHRLGRSRHSLTPRTIRDIETTLRRGLLDRDASVRMASIHAVTVAGDVASLPILRQVRASDPWEMPDTHQHTIRDMADKAITSIEVNSLSPTTPSKK